MKFIFLDIDGVVNIDFSKPISEQMPDRDCMLQLKRIVDTTNAEIVLSSSWRFCEHAKNRLFQSFKAFNIPMWVSETPEVEECNRAREIQAWISDNNPNCRFVILDDVSDACIDGAFVRTNAATGLTAELADRAIEILS